MLVFLNLYVLSDGWPGLWGVMGSEPNVKGGKFPCLNTENFRLIIMLGVQMIVEDKWFVGAVSIPLYIATFFSLALVTSNVIAYIVFGILVLYLVGIVYQRVVVKRVNEGVSQTKAIVQWLTGQLFIIGGWGAAISLLGIDT